MQVSRSGTILALAALLHGCGDNRQRPIDVALADAAPPDAAPADAALPDAAPLDAAMPDAAPPDAAPPDAAPPDAAPPDAAPPDAAPDAAAPDATVPDATMADARSGDAAAPINPLWTVRGPGSPTADNLVRAIAWDASGALWLAGTSWADFTFSESTAWVRRLDEQGAPLWLHTVDVANAEDDFRGVAADGSGEAFAVGRSNGVLLAQKLDARGNVLWSVPPPPPGLDARWAEDGVVGGAGSWVLAGGSFGLGFVSVARYDASGARQETAGLLAWFCDSSGAWRIARSGSGDFLIGGFTCEDEFGAPTFLRRTAPNLQTRFELFDPALRSVQGVAFVDDDLAVCSHRTLHRYSSTGLLQWRLPLDGLCQRIAATAQGHIIVAEAYPDGSARVSSLTGTGTRRWQTSYSGAAGIGASPADLDLGSDGTIYVAGNEMTAGKQIYYVQALAP